MVWLKHHKNAEKSFEIGGAPQKFQKNQKFEKKIEIFFQI